MRDEVQKYVLGIAGILLISPSEHDIGLYLQMKLNRDPGLDTMDEELRADILRIIPEVTEGRMCFFDVLNSRSRANGNN